MPDELTTAVTPVAAPAGAKAQDVTINEQVVEQLARVLPGAVLGLFGPELANQIASAQSIIKDTEARAAAAANAIINTPSGPRPKMTTEQCGHWLQCKLGQVFGMPRPVDQAIDFNGLVTQALGPATGSAGGYLVPDDFVLDIERQAAEPANIWPLIAKRPTNRDSVTLPKETTGVTVNVGASALSQSTTYTDEITETTPVVEQLTWTMRYFDAFVPIKIDMLDDSPLNIMAYVTETVGDGFSYNRERMPLQGLGTSFSQPVGLVSGTTPGLIAGITNITIGGALTLTNLLDGFVAEIPERYSARATLVMNRAQLFQTARLLATGVYSAQYLVSMLPPMRQSAYVPNGMILGGDFSRYVCYYNRLMQMVSQTKARTFTMDIAFVEKWDAQPTRVDAFRIANTITY